MDNNQNRFYTSISKYYSEIFQYQSIQLQFVKNELQELNHKRILDIGCATGELAFQLAKEGAKVTGIDLNNDLLQQAKSNKNHPNLHFQSGNMLELKTDFPHNLLDAVLCFGNTLVHLTDIELIKEMLEGVFTVLKPGGKFLIQILNYDYILDEKVTELPLIETENIRFIRNYEFERNSSVIDFQTHLYLKMEKETISNKTSLLALKSSDLNDLLTNAGFSEVQLYSNFKREPFGGRHLPLVACCKRK